VQKWEHNQVTGDGHQDLSLSGIGLSAFGNQDSAADA
jgi:hypothetical protein